MKHSLETLLKRLSLAAMAVVLATGCSDKKDESTPIVVGREARGVDPNGVSAAASKMKLTGFVLSDPQYQDDFQATVEDLVSSVLPPSTQQNRYIGFVSAQSLDGTGVYIGGQVNLQSGRLNNSTPQRVDIRGDSKLLLMVWDEFAGKKDASGKNVPGIPFFFSKATGYIDGNVVYIKFYNEKYGTADDRHGFIELDGSFNGNVFYGEIYYQNTVRHDGQKLVPIPVRDRVSRALGNFEVPTCQFFQC